MKIVLVLMSAALAFAQTDRAGQVVTTHPTLQQLGVLQSQITALKTEESLSEAKLVELLKTYKESHPNVLALRSKLDRLRAQEDALLQATRRMDAVVLHQRGALQISGLPDRWWKNPTIAQTLAVAPEQVKKMDDVFQQARLKLIDLNAALEREEVTLEPLVNAEPLNELKVAAQIDRVAQARAELEKAHGKMLLGIRKLLTQEQWNKLSQLSSLAAAERR